MKTALITKRSIISTIPFTEKNLSELIKKTGQRPFELLAEGGDCRDNRRHVRTQEVIKAMVMDPNLIQRPIVEVGDKAVLARPIEKVLALLEPR